MPPLAPPPMPEAAEVDDEGTPGPPAAVGAMEAPIDAEEEDKGPVGGEMRDQ